MPPRRRGPVLVPSERQSSRGRHRFGRWGQLIIDNALEAGLMVRLLGSSVTSRIAIGPQQGRKVSILQTLAACQQPRLGCSSVAIYTLAGTTLQETAMSKRKPSTKRSVPENTAKRTGKTRGGKNVRPPKSRKRTAISSCSGSVER